MTVTQYNIYPGLTPVRVVSTSNLSGTYFNGPVNTGVGATLTALTPATLTIDGVAVNVGDRILLPNQTNSNENGIYIVNLNSGTWMITRAADFQSIEQLKAGQYVSISDGTDNAGSIFVLLDPLPATFGIDDLTIVSNSSGLSLGTASTKAASDNTKSTVASVNGNGSITIGDLASFSDVNGTISDVGFKLLIGTSPVWNGGGTSNTFTIAGLTTDTRTVVVVKNQTNAAYIVAFGVTAPNSLLVQFSADPGLQTTVNYVAMVPNV